MHNNFNVNRSIKAHQHIKQFCSSNVVARFIFPMKTLKACVVVINADSQANATPYVINNKKGKAKLL